MYRAHLDSLTVPVWSPFLQRDVMVTPTQFRLLCRLMQNRKGWRQRELAKEVGYQTPGAVSRTLHHLARLGLIAVSTTRGCKGSTVAWIRRGVNALRKHETPNVAQRIRNETDTELEPADVLGNIQVGSILKALLGGAAGVQP